MRAPRRDEIERWGLATFCAWEALALIVGHDKLHPWSHLFWRIRHHWWGRAVIANLLGWLTWHIFFDARDRYPPKQAPNTHKEALRGT